ncbi:IS110 family transposase [Escherichia coli]|nr:IS110 family transposase [Escherichia coli]
MCEVDVTQFLSARESSAWCRLVPRQHSSGGKQFRWQQSLCVRGE